MPNAVGGRVAAYQLHVVGAPVLELLETIVPDVIRGVFLALDPWRSEEQLINFYGGVNDRSALRSSWSTGVADRLDEGRITYDPEGRFPYGDHRARRSS